MAHGYCSSKLRTLTSVVVVDQSLHGLLQAPFVIEENPSQEPPATGRSWKGVLGNVSVVLTRDPKTGLGMGPGTVVVVL